MENKGYLIYEVGILGGNDKGEIKFILFLMFFFLSEFTKLVPVFIVNLQNSLFALFFLLC